MAQPYPQQRIFNLARRLGVSVSEAGRLCSLKGARLRRQRARQCACLPPADPADRIRRLRWDLRADFGEDAA